MSKLYATYTATAKHKASHWEANLIGAEIKVFIDKDDTFYCTSPVFGCSRKYQVITPDVAITMFLREHGYYLIHPYRVD